MDTQAIALTLSREWTQYCKDTESMAFASAANSFVLIEVRTVTMEVEKIGVVQVLAEGSFEYDGAILSREDLWNVVKPMLDAWPRFRSGYQE